MSALEHAKSFWRQALTQPHGLGLIVTDVRRAKQQLYAARKALEDDRLDLSNWSIRTSPLQPAAELWLMRKNREAPLA